MDDRWIQTFTGRRFRPLTPRVQDVCIEDIAHALSNKCRFTGHTREFYSVAQHSVICSAFVDPPDFALAALLHDAAEAYLPDVASPIKSSLVGFRDIEEAVLRTVFAKFSVPFSDYRDEVKEVDLRALRTERRDLMDRGPCWRCDAVPPLPFRITPWSPQVAERAFLYTYKVLTEGAR